MKLQGAAPGLNWAAGAKHVPGAMPHTARVQQPPAADGNFKVPPEFCEACFPT